MTLGLIIGFSAGVAVGVVAKNQILALVDVLKKQFNKKDKETE